MATRTSNGKRFGNVEGWGIALKLADGTIELVATAEGRMAIRELKREVYPGSDYKTVRVKATLFTYSK